MITPQQLRRLAAPSYIAAASLILFPVFDQLMQLVSTAKIHDARWRFGAAGLLSNMLILPVVGLMIVLVLAAALEHRAFQRVMAVLCAIGAVGLVLATGLFMLDAIQVRGLMRPEAASSWGVATGTAVIKLIVAGLALVGFAIASFHNSKTAKPVPRASSPSFVVGSSKGKPAAAGASAEN
jgi:hypothetical protein